MNLKIQSYNFLHKFIFKMLINFKKLNNNLNKN